MSAGGPRGRGRRLIAPLRSATVLAVVCSVAALASPGTPGEALGWAVIAVVFVMPLARVGFLAVRWGQLADRRFALLAGVLVAEVGGAAALALAR